MAFCRNGYFLLLGNSGIRDSDSKSSITEVIIDSATLRKFSLLVHKRSNNQDWFSINSPVKKQRKVTGESFLNWEERCAATEAHVESDGGNTISWPPGNGPDTCNQCLGLKLFLESHLKWWFASSHPDFVLFTKETPMVKKITQQPQNSWQVLVNQKHTGLSEDGKNRTKSNPSHTGYKLNTHIPDEALPILTGRCVFN